MKATEPSRYIVKEASQNGRFWSGGWFFSDEYPDAVVMDNERQALAMAKKLTANNYRVVVIADYGMNNERLIVVCQ